MKTEEQRANAEIAGYRASIEQHLGEINALYADLAQARADIETVSRERDAAVLQVSRLTEAIEKHRDRYLAHLQASECNQADRDLWSVLAAAARQGEKEKA